MRGVLFHLKEIVMGFPTLDLFMQEPRKGDPLRRPIAYIQLLMRTRIENHPDAIFISPDCVSYRELEAHVIRLKKELDDILKRGKKELSEVLKKALR